MREILIKKQSVPSKLIQTRVSSESQKGNCYAAVIASLMGLSSAEDAIQIQEHYDDDDWPLILDDWLNSKGWEWYTVTGHHHGDVYYLVSGKSPRGVQHICIYQNGKLWHDPHPDQTGLVTEEHFEVICPKS